MMSYLIWASLQQTELEMERARIAQREWAAYAQRSAIMAQYPYYVPSLDWETALYRDHRVGFAAAVPGYPRPMPVIYDHGEPPHDALMNLGDIPISVRFHLGMPTVSGATGQDVVTAQMSSFTDMRTWGQAPDTERIVGSAKDRSVRIATADQVRGWGVDAGATTSFDLPAQDAFGADREEVVMLVRQGALMTITLRYPRNGVDIFRGALLRSALLGSIRWDPRQFIQGPPALWPESTFLEKRVTGMLKPYRDDQIPHLGPAFVMPDSERRAFVTEIERVVARPDPPWAPVSRGDVEALIFALTGATTNPKLEPLLRSIVPEIRTMHDLRGCALLMARAAFYAWRSG